MKTAKRLALMALCGLASTLAFAQGANSPAAAERPKNWTPPPYRIYAQTLSDQIVAQHPELLSVTFHGVPPGMSKVYTMFAGSYPDRSEEHTSELQSRGHLVCRLLLEKKKTRKKMIESTTLHHTY